MARFVQLITILLTLWILDRVECRRSNLISNQEGKFSEGKDRNNKHANGDDVIRKNDDITIKNALTPTKDRVVSLGTGDYVLGDTESTDGGFQRNKPIYKNSDCVELLPGENQMLMNSQVESTDIREIFHDAEDSKNNLVEDSSTERTRLVMNDGLRQHNKQTQTDPQHTGKDLKSGRDNQEKYEHINYQNLKNAMEIGGRSEQRGASPYPPLSTRMVSMKRRRQRKERNGHLEQLSRSAEGFRLYRQKRSKGSKNAEALTEEPMATELEGEFEGEEEEEGIEDYEARELEKIEEEHIDFYGNLMDELKRRPSVKYQISPFDYSAGKNNAVILVFSPFKILSVDEREQSVTISSYLIVKWNDDALRWKQMEHNGIKSLTIRTSEIWTPDILVPQANGDGFRMPKPEYVLLRPDLQSNVRMATLFKFTVSCDFNMALYPFDTQKCIILFVDEQDRPLRTKTSQRTTEDSIRDYFGTSGEWEITDSQTDDINDTYNKQFYFKHPLQFSINMQRRSAFYIANLIVPVYITSFIALFVFWIPPETGEKVSFMVSIYVSTAMYISIINDVLPRSLSFLPAFNVVIVLVNVEIGLTFIATLIVLRLYRRHLELEKKETATYPTNPSAGSSADDAMILAAIRPEVINHEPRYKLPLTPEIFRIRRRTGKVNSSNLADSPSISTTASRADFLSDSLSTRGDVDNGLGGNPSAARKLCRAIDAWLDYQKLDKIFFVLFAIGYFMSLFVPWFVHFE